MRAAVSSVIVVGVTLAFLSLLFVLQPFALFSDSLDRAFGALPAWTQVMVNVYLDPVTQDVSRGDDLPGSLRILSADWARHPDAERVMLMGNSQTLLASLTRKETPPAGPEKMYPDYLADLFREAGSHKVFYRLSAGAMSYQEMVWDVLYLSQRPDVKPNVLLVQLNYQNLVNGGIRGGMVQMLSDVSFRREIEALAARGGPEADSFAEALRAFDERQKRGPATSNEGVTPGYRLETAVRADLDGDFPFRWRARERESFSLMLTRMRVYFLRLGSNRARSLAGGRVAASRAALEDLAAACQRAGIRMVLFEAPTNPAVPLYLRPEDDRAYHEFSRSLAARYHLSIFDFEHAVPAEEWGQALNVPDPLHLSRAAHHRMARLLYAEIERSGF